MTKTHTKPSPIPRDAWSRTSPISVKLHPQTVLEIDAAAAARRMSRSEFIRYSLEQQILEQQRWSNTSPLPVVISE